MTVKIYQFDSYKRELESTIRSIEGNAVKLDKTIFYPTSGGQSCDTGFIDGTRVMDVKIRNNDIFHYVEKPEKLSVNKKVICKIDWGRRFTNMQRHTGQHLLSGILFRKFKLNTISSHLGNGYSTIDIEWRDNLKELIPEIEAMVNSAIEENRPIYTYTVKNKNDLLHLPLRRPPKVNQNIRIVEIEEYDVTPCGGTHLKSTGELWLLKITKIERYKGMWRITFVSGKDFTGYSLSKLSILEKIKEEYSIPTEELISRIGKLQDKLSKLKIENTKLREIYLESVFLQMKSSGVYKSNGFWIYHYLFDEKNMETEIKLKSVLNTLSKQVLILKQITDKNPAILVLGKTTDSNMKIILWSSHLIKSKENILDKIFNHLKVTFNAKGGGKGNLYNLTIPESSREVFEKVLAEIYQFPYN